MLQDASGRSIGYLQLSLTKACAMRCRYCRPQELLQPHGEPRGMLRPKLRPVLDPAGMRHKSPEHSHDGWTVMTHIGG